MEHLSLKNPHAVLCKKWTVTMRTFLKNDGWKPVPRFITYEFEQLVCLLFTPLGWRSHLTVSTNSISFFAIKMEGKDQTNAKVWIKT